jgi:hypothetical protein
MSIGERRRSYYIQVHGWMEKHYDVSRDLALISGDIPGVGPGVGRGRIPTHFI